MPYNASSAYFQFRVAELEGGDEAGKLLKNDLDMLSTELGADRTAEINAQAEGWRQRHHVALEFVYKQEDDVTGFPASALAVPEDGAHAAVLVPVEAE